MLRTIVASHKKTNEMAPNRNLTLKTSALKHPYEEYFGTKGKMAVIISQNLKENEKNII